MQAKDSDVMSVTREFPIVVDNPVVVENNYCRTIGSATVKMVDGGLSIDLHLDRNTPEAFDCSIDPGRVSMELGGCMVNGHLALKIYLATK
jgi:hypothetical protein